MEEDRTPEAFGSRSVGRYFLLKKDVCKRDLMGAGIDFRELEGSVEDTLSWKQAVSAGVAAAEYVYESCGGGS